MKRGSVNVGINNDITQRVVLHTPQMDWVGSPASGVQRKMLERVGDEVARATSIGRYEPGASFAAHVHGGGEEILVLDGVFSDEHAQYPAGTYLRHPPGSQHSPASQTGCLLLVKLWQFCPGDHQSVLIDTRSAQWYQGMVPGLTVLPLHEFNGVNTALVRWAPDTLFNRHVHPGGEEIFVLEGVFHDEYGSYPAGSWIRSPRYSLHTPFTKGEGALIYVKTGHLDAEYLPLP
jgi:anti-sigma factor ChrR (cupin superfamily)